VKRQLPDEGFGPLQGFFVDLPKVQVKSRRPPEECRRRPRLGAAHAADRMDAREKEEMVTSEVLTHVQVSLIDRASDSLRPASGRCLLNSSPLAPQAPHPASEPASA
jgi:hypothetical protein